jgi:hypothetical protein
MKTLIAFFLFLSVASFGQPDNSPIIVEVRNSAKLQWNGAAVKQKIRVLDVAFIRNGQKEFYFHGYLERYENNGGAYGSKITDLISADSTLSAEEKADLLNVYGDKEIAYTTNGKYSDANGNLVSSDTPGAIPDLQYWQSIKMNNAALGMTSASTQGALDGIYKIIDAIVDRMNARKNF